jgi:Probable zinc-ribbon domain
MKAVNKLNNNSFSDVILTCCDCNGTFPFSAGEQAFYHSKALSIPHRCPACRRRRRESLVPDINQLFKQNNGQAGNINDNYKQR